MKTSLNQDRLDSCSSISHMFSSDNEEQTELNEAINNYDTSTCTPAPIARVSFTPAMGITSTSTPTESNETINISDDASTCTPAPIARVSFTPALGITSTSTPTVLATDMFSDISDNEEETESNKTINGALKVRKGN